MQNEHESLLNEAQGYLQAGDANSCRQRCLAVIEQDDNNGEAYSLLGAALSSMRMLDEAADAFQRALALDPDAAQAHHNLGHVLRQQGRLDEAVRCFQKALSIDPGYGIGHQSLGIVSLMLGKSEAAEQSFEQALKLIGNDPYLLTYLGMARHEQKNFTAAVDAYRAAERLNPNDPVTQAHLARTLQETGDLDAAATAYRHALASQPDDAKLHEELASLLLARKNAEAALAEADVCLKLIPGHGGALTSRAMALYQLDRLEEADRLVDFDRFVATTTVRTPAEFSSLEDFNAALSRHVSEHPTLSFEPEGHATRHGKHTGDLLAGEKGPISFLQVAINKEVETYVREHPQDTGHPFLTNSPQRWSLVMWAVIMDTQGHQLPHVHPAAWLSGVYYVKLPPVMGSGNGNHAGWIEFGRPSDNIRGDANPPVRSYKPHEGMIVLFPSYFFHRTEPFESDETRISIAFDVMRKD